VICFPTLLLSPRSMRYNNPTNHYIAFCSSFCQRAPRRRWHEVCVRGNGSRRDAALKR
jgi:hypothetical protein